MLLDPTGEFIRNIALACDIDGEAVLEIGCGSGRITRDLASRAREVVAIDPDAAALGRARAQVSAASVSFVQASAETYEVIGRAFDAAVFSLSLHHLAPGAMDASLLQVARGLRPGGRIVAIEPGDDGTLIEAETRFDVGDGDERSAKEAAHHAVRRLAGWTLGTTLEFRTLFHFDDVADFLEHLPPRGARPASTAALTRFLESHRDGDRIVLWAARRLDVLVELPKR